VIPYTVQLFIMSHGCTIWFYLYLGFLGRFFYVKFLIYEVFLSLKKFVHFLVNKVILCTNIPTLYHDFIKNTSLLTANDEKSNSYSILNNNIIINILKKL
jgi:hypothetical protein